MTTLYGIIGHPVGQVRSPSLFNGRFAAAGIDAVMVPLDVPPQSFARVLGAMRDCANVAGLVVTVPHKLQAAALARSSSQRVGIVGAANVLRPVDGGWEAELFDGVGFVAGLKAQGHSAAGMNACVVGAGGAGLAIAEALLAEGAQVVIGDIDRDRARNAALRLREVYGNRIAVGEPSADHQLVVNATPVGMAGDPSLPFDLDRLRRDAVVADAIMKPPVTPLLERAAARSHPIIAGKHMLDGQVQAIWDFLNMG